MEIETRPSAAFSQIYTDAETEMYRINLKKSGLKNHRSK